MDSELLKREKVISIKRKVIFKLVTYLWFYVLFYDLSWHRNVTLSLRELLPRGFPYGRLYHDASSSYRQPPHILCDVFRRACNLFRPCPHSDRSCSRGMTMGCMVYSLLQ